ncbi:MAG TPA: malto-oligosyltrehalose trehalohydrolase [Acidimicrobiales bacterium]|nr:malto-oligosyltrehalose trehalohydrolase [Acidimicrobiales bacterium]
MSHRFGVWAPNATTVDVVIEGKRRPMTPAAAAVPFGAGWWGADVEEAGPGTDYGFSLDGGPVRPDPRSPWQPEGIDGASRVVDHSRFHWASTERAWRGLYLPSAVLYELHVGTFSPEGTFDGAARRLDHLVDLGIDGIELLPVAEFSGDRGWGYDGVDLYAPHHAYGGPDGLKRLVEACHARGLGVVMDVVYNHLGPAGNYLAEFGPYFTDKHHTNWGAAVNFDDADSGEVRRFVIDNALMWLQDYHCDGLRLDAVHAIKDESAFPVIESLTAAVAALVGHVRRPLFVVAESDLNDPRVVRPPSEGGWGANAVWADEFHHALHATLSGERDGYYADFGALGQVAKALRDAWVFTGDFSPYRRRVHGRRAPELSGSQFVVFLQNHDQVGNRAVGDRITSMPLVRKRPGRARVGAALMLLSPFVPMLFQGEEWAASSPFLYFTDHRDPDLGRAVSEGRRREFASFGWAPSDVPDPQDPSSFTRSKLDWDEVVSGEHASMLTWYRELISLRRQHPELADGRRDQVHTAYDEDEEWLAMRRGAVIVAANLASVAKTVVIPTVFAIEGDTGTLLAASEPDVTLSDEGSVFLPPDSVAVVRWSAGG